jgi:hypothetical protein
MSFVLVLPIILVQSRIEDEFVRIDKLIDEVCGVFDIDSRVFVSVIYAERILNYNFLDRFLDFEIVRAGYNTSVGFAR